MDLRGIFFKGKPLKDYLHRLSGEELEAEMRNVIFERTKVQGKKGAKCRIVPVYDEEHGPVRHYSKEEMRREEIIMRAEDMKSRQGSYSLDQIIEGILNWDFITKKRVGTSRGDNGFLTVQNLSKHLQKKNHKRAKLFVPANVSSKLAFIYRALGPPHNFLTRQKLKGKGRAFVYTVSDDLKRLSFSQVSKIVVDFTRAAWRDAHNQRKGKVGQSEEKIDKESGSEEAIPEDKQSEGCGGVEGVLFKGIPGPVKSLGVTVDLSPNGFVTVKLEIETKSV